MAVIEELREWIEECRLDLRLQSARCWLAEVKAMQAENHRLRELCGNAYHWLAVPPTTGSDRHLVGNLLRQLHEAAELTDDE